MYRINYLQVFISLVDRDGSAASNSDDEQTEAAHKPSHGSKEKAPKTVDFSVEEEEPEKATVCINILFLPVILSAAFVLYVALLPQLWRRGSVALRKRRFVEKLTSKLSSDAAARRNVKTEQVVTSQPRRGSLFATKMERSASKSFVSSNHNCVTSDYDIVLSVS